jgi:uncharacterized membrane protein YeaQ/YmgE (transglycosylase-associated protein family)
MGIVWTIVLGFVIGVIAKLLLPGRQNMGFIVTVLLGIGGSLCAGVVGQFFGWYQAGEGAGFIASVIMAVILLVIYGKIRGGPSFLPSHGPGALRLARGGKAVDHAPHGLDLQAIARVVVGSRIAPPVPAGKGVVYPLPRAERQAVARNGLRVEDDNAVVVGPGVVARALDEALPDLCRALTAAVEGDMHPAARAATRLRHIDVSLIGESGIDWLAIDERPLVENQQFTARGRCRGCSGPSMCVSISPAGSRSPQRLMNGARALPQAAACGSATEIIACAASGTLRKRIAAGASHSP